MKKVGLKPFNSPINHYNVFYSDGKNFKKILSNYVIPLNGSLPIAYRSLANQLFEDPDPLINIKNIFLANLQVLAEKAMEENILISGIGYLITEEYINARGEYKMHTIDYLNNFKNLDTLLRLYEQHLDEILEGGMESGDIVSLEPDSGKYNIQSLHLRILIPKDLIKAGKVPASFLALPAPPSYEPLLAPKYSSAENHTT